MTAKTRFKSLIQVHLTFIIQYVIYTLIMLCFEIYLSYPSNNVSPKQFVFLLVINYFVNYCWIIFSQIFMQREKLFKCFVSSQFLHTHKNK